MTRRAFRFATKARSPTPRPSRARRGRTPTRSRATSRRASSARRRGAISGWSGDTPSVLGDGAPWIWNIAADLFPDAIQIVDRYHANEHLSGAVKAIYGPDNDLRAPWTHARCSELKAGKIDLVLAALAAHANIEEARQCQDYIQTNRDRMRYGEFHAAGLCTSTGVVESACKRAIGIRLKRGGMFWTVSGANAIIALRCCRLSGRFEDFWERRSSQTAA